MDNTFKSLNEFIKLTAEEYESKKLLEDIDTFMFKLDEAIEAGTPITTSLANESRYVASLSPQECKRLIEDVNEMKQQLNAVYKTATIKPKEPGVGQQFMRSITSIGVMMGASFLIRKITQGISLLWNKFKEIAFNQESKSILPTVLIGMVSCVVLYKFIRFLINKFRGDKPKTVNEQALDVLDESITFENIFSEFLNEDIQPDAQQVIDAINKNQEMQALYVQTGDFILKIPIVGKKLRQYILESVANHNMKVIEFKASLVGDNNGATTA